MVEQYDFNGAYYLSNDGSVCVCKKGDIYAVVDGRKGHCTFNKILKVDLSTFKRVEGIINDINSLLEEMIGYNK